MRAAAERIATLVHRTPVLTCAAFDALAGASLFFKCENFQRAGAFKFRGACNTVRSLGEDELRRGVITHSSGNHGAALALAAKLHGARATVVVPRGARAAKLRAIEGYGAEIVICDPTQAAREATVAALVAERGATLVHPFDDPRVIAGQGTAALELIDEVPDLDAIVAPVGGGGLLAGTAIAASGQRVLGAEPAAADDAARSLRAGHRIPAEYPDTIADGLRTSIGEITFPVIRERVADIATVEEDAIAAAMRLVWERMKIVIEPSAAVAPAALIGGRIGVSGRRVGVLLSGGNVDLDDLPWRHDPATA